VLTFARVVLMVGGSAMLVAGLVVAALGLFAGAWLLSLLPQVVVNAPAVGGAAFALGVLVAAAGACQVTLAASVRRSGRWTTAGAAVLTGLLAALLIACAVAAVTEVARGGTPWLLGASLGLTAAAFAYAAGAWKLGRASAQLPEEPQ
jgi:hypothetical protein